jgi:hypothetical protein
MASPASELQRALYAALTGNAGVAALCGRRVYDRVPEKPVFPYVSFGASQSVNADADCIAAGEHFLQIDVWSRKPGRLEAKDLTHAVKLALHGAGIELASHALALIEVEGERHFTDPDGLTTHGVVNLRAMIEEKDEP